MIWDKSGTNSILLFLVNLVKRLIGLVIAGGLEPPTYCLEGPFQYYFNISISYSNYRVIPYLFIQYLLKHCLVLYRGISSLYRSIWDKSGTKGKAAYWLKTNRIIHFITSNFLNLNQILARPGGCNYGQIRRRVG